MMGQRLMLWGLLAAGGVLLVQAGYWWAWSRGRAAAMDECKADWYEARLRELERALARAIAAETAARMARRTVELEVQRVRVELDARVDVVRAGYAGIDACPVPDGVQHALGEQARSAADALERLRGDGGGEGED